MKIAIPRETDPKDKRVPMVPECVEKLAKAGAEVLVEGGVGVSAEFPDESYRAAGAAVVTDRAGLLADGDVILRLKKPPDSEVDLMKRGAIHVSFLDPFTETELIGKLAARGIAAISMELIARTTRAQKMDALSSQANLAGYVAVIQAAAALDKILPMMTTPSGTIPPARVFIIGAGVAGLQAVATAKRLGAIVEAYDTRPVVEEQVRSLGGRFVKIDLGETGQTEQGYARELTPEQLEKQREGMARHLAKADIVITTAQVFGRRAPRIVTASMLDRMKPGSVVVDLAVESGGNVEGSRPDETVVRNGVRILGMTRIAGKVATDSSRMYANNITAIVLDFWDKDRKEFVINLEDDIMQSCLVTHNGAVVHPLVREKMKELKA